MPVLVTSKFDEDPIKYEQASLDTPFSHYTPNSVGSGPIWQKFELVRDFMPVLVTCKFEKDLTKTTEKRRKHSFPHYKSMGDFCCHGNQSFDPIRPPNIMQPFPNPNDASYKI